MKAASLAMPGILPVRIIDRSNKAIFGLNEPMTFDRAEEWQGER